MGTTCLILLHSEQPKLYGVLAVLSAIGLNGDVNIMSTLTSDPSLSSTTDGD